MAGTQTIPELHDAKHGLCVVDQQGRYLRPDGSAYLTRVEMENVIRTVWKTVHARRLKAIKPYDFDRKIAYDVRPILVLHYILDEMVRRGQIHGDQIGVGATTENDQEFKEFTVKLAQFVQSGQAIQPTEGEGINMSDFGRH